MSWWSTPGPGGFLEQVVRTLTQRKMVVLDAPVAASCSLRSALQYQEAFVGEEYRADCASGRSPLSGMVQRFCPDARSISSRSERMRALADADRFAGRVLFVCGLDAATWRSWRDFMLEVWPVVRAKEILERTTFCLEVPADVGDDEIEPLVDAERLLFRYEGQVAQSDMLSFAAELVRAEPGVERQLTIRLIAELAQYDFELARELAQPHDQLVLQTLHEPHDLLLRYAAQREWMRLNGEDERTRWCAGRRDRVDREPRRHSACLAVSEDSYEIGRRIWNAQVAVLFPYLDTIRRRYLRQYEALLDLALVPEEDKVVSIDGLELSHINHQLNAYKDIGRDALKPLRYAKHARDELAHLRPLPYHKVQQLL